jgi:hypothetical protein
MSNNLICDEVHDAIVRELWKYHPSLTPIEEIALKARLVNLIRSEFNEPDELFRLFREAMDGV